MREREREGWNERERERRREGRESFQSSSVDQTWGNEKVMTFIDTLIFLRKRMSTFVRGGERKMSEPRVCIVQREDGGERGREEEGEREREGGRRREREDGGTSLLIILIH